MPSIIYDLPATGNHPLGLHCIISIAERWTSCWFVPLGGPSRGALRHHSSDCLRQRPSVGGYASQFALRAHPTRRLWRGRITRRTSYRRFIGDFVHSSLLRRGATEPPEAPISQTPRLPAAKANPLCALCAPRLCVKISQTVNPTIPA